MFHHPDAQPEDFLTDETFLAWHFETDERASAAFEAWLKQHPEKGADVRAAIRLLTALSAEAPAVEATRQRRAWNQVRQNVEDWENRPVRIVPFYQRRAFVAAASALLVLLAGLLYFFNARPLRYETDYAQTRRVQLPDGSRVMLNANSRLRLARNWTDATAVREVWLEGEAYFEVRHTARHSRFVVHTAALNVEVLGTSFNVRNRADRVQVMLDAGKVRLEQPASRQTVLMRPGEVAEATAARIQAVRRAETPREYTAWRENRLVFNETPLAEVARMIEFTYGYPVRIAPGLEDRTFTYSLYGNDLDLLLNTLAESLDLRVTRQGNHLDVQEKN